MSRRKTLVTLGGVGHIALAIGVDLSHRKRHHADVVRIEVELLHLMYPPARLRRSHRTSQQDLGARLDTRTGMGPLGLLMAWITEVATRIAITAIMTRNAVDRENDELHPVLMTTAGARNVDKPKAIHIHLSTMVHISALVQIYYIKRLSGMNECKSC